MCKIDPEKCCPETYDSRDRYRFFFQQSSSLNVIVEADGTIVEINDAVKDVLGYTSDEVVGRSVFDFIVRRQKTYLKERLKRLFEGNTTGEEVVDAFDISGKVRTLFFPGAGTKVFNGVNGDTSILLTMIDVTERLRMQNELKIRNERYRDVFHGVDVGLVVVDRVGRVIEVNRGFSDMTGIPVNEVLNHSAAGIVIKYLDRKDALTIAANIGRLLMGRSVPDYEFKFNDRVFRLSTPMIRWSSSTFTGILMDVTAEHQLEQILEIQRDLAGELSATSDREKAFSIIINHVLKLYDVDSCGIYIFDDTMNAFILRASSGFGDAFLQSCSLHNENSPQYRVAMEGRSLYGHFSDTVSFMDEECRKEGLRAVAALPVYHEGTVVASLNLASHTVDEFKPMIRDAVEVIAGQLGGVLARIMAEARLRESEERFRAVFVNAEEIVFIKNTKLVYTHVNPAFLRLFDCTMSDIVGKSDSDLFSRDEAEHIKWVDMDILNGEVVEYEDVLKIHGEMKTFLTVKVPLKDSMGTIVGLCGFARDITKRKNIEDELRKSRARDKAALAEKEVLLREIHHRVKNNLQVISSLLSLQRELIDDDNYRQMFTDSVNRIRSMGAIHEMLYQSDDLGHIDAGDYLSGIVESLSGVYAIPVNNVSVNVDVDAPPLDLDHAIPCGLVVNELVSNAFKHAFPHDDTGEIIIRMRGRDDGFVMFEISDNGIGMPEHFDWQVADSLGLKIVRLLTEHQLRGSIELLPGKGAAFRITYNSNDAAG